MRLKSGGPSGDAGKLLGRAVKTFLIPEMAAWYWSRHPKIAPEMAIMVNPQKNESLQTWPLRQHQ